MASDQEDKSVAGAAVLAAAAFAIALVLTIVFAWQQGPIRQSASSAQAVAPQAQVTTDSRENTSSLERPAPSDTTGAGPGQNASR